MNKVPQNSIYYLHFSLPKYLLGLLDWNAYIVKDTEVSVQEINDLNIKEYNIFIDKSELAMDHNIGVSHLKVKDSGLILEGDTLRIKNEVVKVTSIEPIEHLLTLDKPLSTNYFANDNVSKVEYPDLLGRYYCEITMNVNPGTYKIILVDNTKQVKDIVEDIEIYVENIENIQQIPAGE